GCDAALTPVLVGPGGGVLHVGRRSRSVPASLRKALNLRDRRCQWPGCTMPPEHCESHHVRHWADDGSTDLPNLRLYCRRHHRQLHPENRRF
ncbi:MAG TPA: HNH endonuclease signature motif containing protein, partial [Candidatus Dormibacteraeota bacterium]|nr:HNH endonuclease signature motif containing protein [Candidatus Dormibacteraeota bacterium]